nr:unnamed protein product [Callosobruchus analis]
MTFMHERNNPGKGIQIGGEYDESESSGEETQVETQNSSVLESEGVGETSGVPKEINFISPMQAETVLMQKSSTSTPNTPNT